MTNATQPRDLSFLAPGWAARLGQEFDQPYMEALRAFLRSEYTAGRTVYPAKDRLFRALKLVDYDDVKVVILGQDPYHGYNQANGLAFAVSEGVQAPPSLQNIFKEIAKEMGTSRLRKDTTLEDWAKQGVLLLNTVLTVRAGEAFSHRNKGWENFTDKVIKELNDHSRPLVFFLWGAAAQAKEKMLTNSRHLVLKSAHPSPLSVHRGFFGCGHFAKANEFLKQFTSPIDWDPGEVAPSASTARSPRPSTNERTSA